MRSRQFGLVTLLALSLVLGAFAAAGAFGSPRPSSEALPTPAASIEAPGSMPQMSLASQAPNAGKAGNIRFDRISLDQGLSQSVVQCILQDSRGFMWFCTQDGLNRYDGYDFVVYKYDPDDPYSLSDNLVQSLYEDASGAIWVGTNGGGLNRFDPQTGRFTSYQSDGNDPNSLSNNNVAAIAGDPSGALWIGTAGGGLDRFDPATERFAHYQNDPNEPGSLSHNVVLSVHQDRQGVLWVGTAGGGLSRLDSETGQFTHYQNNPGDPDSLSHDFVTAIHEDRSGVLWIGTGTGAGGGGLDRFDRATGRFVHYQNDPDDIYSLSEDFVQSILEDASGTLWIGTNSGGLNRFDRNTGRFLRYRNDPEDPTSLSSDDVPALYQDRASVLWAGTFGGGVNRFDLGKNKFTCYRNDPNDPNSLSDNLIWTFFQDHEGVLWIGTNSGGVNRFDRKTGVFAHYRNNPDDPNSLSGDAVWSVYEDSEGVMWMGTNAGLDRFDRSTEQFTHYSTAFPVFTIYQDIGGSLWIGTIGGGLGKFDRESGQIMPYTNDPSNPNSLSHDFVVSIRQDRYGLLWLATFNGGLDRFDLDTETFIHHQSDPGDPSSLSHNTVLTVHEDRAGVLWAGTASGFNRFHRETGTFTHYTEQDGLPNNVVYGILEDDDGNLWLSTNSGLSRFDPRTETFRNYDVSDGLQSNEFNQSAYFRTSSGEMFFGGINGFNAFYPNSIRDNPYIPPILITDFQLFNESVPVGGDSPLQKPIVETRTIELTYQQDFFSFTFAALHYSAPEENLYAYKMEGLDRDWNYVGTRRFAGYTNVPPGDYTFWVIGSNSDGIWNTEGASIRVIIAPPVWQTWWFRILAAVVVVGSTLGGVAWRIRSIESQRRQLEAQVNDRTTELRETLAELQRSKEAAEAANRAKSAFLANMSHELRTPLNAILGFSQLLIRSAHTGQAGGSNLTPDQREDLAVINRSGEHLLGLINDVLEMSKIEAGRTLLNKQDFDLHNLLGGLEEMFRLRAEGKGLTLTSDVDPNVPRYVKMDEGKLRQVLMNLLGNAVKFTRQGVVTLRVRVPTATSGAVEEGRLRFEVEDTGPGIAPEELEIMFNPFVQTTSGQVSQEGTGLGLSISRQFTRLMGGDIAVRSEVGKGSVFIVDLPIEEADPLVARAAQPSRWVVGLQPGQPVYRLLAVDDKEVNRQLLIKLLTPLGFDVRAAANGKEAVEIWEQWEPHLIWMDMRMPVMDGYEATRRIKATTKGQATVIVALTASALEEDRLVMLSEGCDAYVRKPFQEEELFDVLAKHLGVRFAYEEMARKEWGKAEEARLNGRALAASQGQLVDRLTALPSDLVVELEQATRRANLDLVLALIDRIREADAALASVLADLANNFAYADILKLINEAGDRDESEPES